MSKRLMHEAMEAIWFQDGEFGKALEKEFKSLIEKSENKEDADNSKEVKNIQAIVLSFTGLPIQLRFSHFTCGNIRYPELKFNHIFNFDQEDADSVAMIKEALSTIQYAQREITIDLRNSKVTGFKAHNPTILTLGYKNVLLNKSLSVGNIVAIFLHEIGHMFVNLEFTNRFITTNQFLALMSKSLLNKDSVSTRKLILKQAGKTLADDEKAFDSLEEITDQKIITTVFIDRSFKKAASELGIGVYDETSCESLADQFVARHGYGRQLIEALHFIDSKTDFQRKSIIGQFIFNAKTLIPFALVTLYPLSVLTYSFIFALSVFISGSDNKDFSYPNVKTRYKRIREQEVENLKLSILDKSSLTERLTTIEKMDTIISKLNDNDEDIFEKIHLFFSKKSRDVKAAIQLQRDLEELSANNLFVASAKLAST